MILTSNESFLVWIFFSSNCVHKFILTLQPSSPEMIDLALKKTHKNEY